MRQIPKIWGWIFMAYAAVYLSFGAYQYVTGPVDVYDAAFREKYLGFLSIVWIHGVSSALALALGPFLFLPRSWKAAHRCLGLLYFACVFVGGLSAIPMSLIAYGGAVAQLGFLTLSGLWLGSASLALSEAAQRRYASHRRWTVRCFGLTYSAVFIRVSLDWLQTFGYSFEQLYPYSAWLGWLLPLGLAEFLIRRTR